MTNRLSIRVVQLSDAGRLAEIYSYYVLNTAVSFEYEAPSVDEFIERIKNTIEKYPYLVCEKNDLVVGYASLELELKKQGILNLLAGVAFSEKEDEFLSHDSYLFHIKEGYEKVAHLKAVGKKFHRWYDLLWMQKTMTNRYM